MKMVLSLRNGNHGKMHGKIDPPPSVYPKLNQTFTTVCFNNLTDKLPVVFVFKWGPSDFPGVLLWLGITILTVSNCVRPSFENFSALHNEKQD
jgi:hypothetical protein